MLQKYVNHSTGFDTFNAYERQSNNTSCAITYNFSVTNHRSNYKYLPLKYLIMLDMIKIINTYILSTIHYC